SFSLTHVGAPLLIQNKRNQRRFTKHFGSVLWRLRVFPPITKIIKISMQISPRCILALHADKRAGEEAAALDVIIRKLVGIQRNRNFSPVFAIKGIRIMISVRLNIDPQVYILNV